MIFLNLLHNTTLLVSLGILYGIIIRRWRPGSAPYRAYSGLLFGSVALVGMLTPLQLAPGVIFDGRSIILSLAGLFGGATAALIAALMSATFRIWLGGGGTLMGVSVIAESALLGVVYGQLRSRYTGVMHPFYILLFGVLVHAVMLAMTRLLPGGFKEEVLDRIALPVMTLYPLAVLLLSLLFLDMEAHIRAEIELVRSEENYRLLVENANSIIVRWTPDGVIRFMNDFGLHFFGYEQEELIGRPLVGTIIPPADSSGLDLDMMIREILKCPEQYESNENENVCKDGRRVWVHWANRAIRNVDGSLREFYSIGDDITERRRAQREVEESEQLFRRLIEGAPDGIFVQTSGCFTYLNRVALDLFGAGAESDLLGTPVLDRIHPDYHASVRERIRQLNEEHRDQPRAEQVFIRLNGTCVNGEFSGVPIHYCGQDGALVFFRDISERKKAEQAMKESESMYRSLFENMLNGFAYCRMLFDEDGAPKDFIYLAVNQAFEQQTGLKGVAGKRVSEIIPGIRESDSKLLEIYGRVATTGQPERFEIYVAALEMWFWLSVYSPARGHFVAVFDVITERKNTEQALLDSERKYRNLFEYMVTGFALHEIIVDDAGKPVDCRILEVNPAFEKLTGLRVEDIQGSTILKVKPDVNPLHIEFYGKVALTGEPTIFEDYNPLLARYYEILAYSPQKGQFALIMSDITARKKAEAELLLSEEKIRNILRVQPVGVGMVIDRLFKEANDQFCEMLGYPREEIIDRDTEFIYPTHEEYARVGEHYRTVEKMGYGKIDTRFRRKDGCILDILLNVALIDRNDYSKGVAFTALDITERKRIESELIRNQEKMNSILRLQPVGVGLVVNRIFKEVNKHYCEIVGYAREEILERNSAFLYATPEEFEAVGRFFNSLENHGSGTIEVRHRRKDGRMIDLLLSVAPHDRQDYSKGLIFAALDITERKRAEQRLRFLASTVEQAIESVIIRDVQGLIQYVNPAFEASSGYTSEEVIGRELYFMEFNSENQALLREIIDTTRGGKVWSGRVKSLCKDGESLTEDVSITPIRDDKGEIISYVTLKKDVTRELELEDQLRVSQKLEAVGLLAGGVAHDLNNLLTPILGYAEMLLLEESIGESAQRDIQEIVSAGGRARDLIGQLMAFGRKQTLQVKALDMNAVISNTGKLLRRTLRENIRIELHLPASIQAVRADRTQVDQVLMNLAVNAQDAMPEGGVLSIETQDTELDADYANHHPGVIPGRYVMLSVADTGMGMDPEIRARIFDPFFTTKPVGQGTGLGLATVYGIVKQHGGHVWVYSEPGHGSIFKVYLPAIDQDPVESGEASAQSEAPGGTETLLVAEDDPTVRDLACTMLSGLGYKVLSGKTVSQCLELASGYPDKIDLLLTDVIMPHMSGRELYNRLRQSRPELRVLYMSGYAANLIADRGVLDEGICFIQKPFSRLSLARKVRECLNA
ncbi:PAS domain S-box protein [bacterium]|nr:PAS domain S-box protein [bacterium]